MTTRLTDVMLKRVPTPKGTDRTIWDSVQPGLGFKATGAGRRFWVLQKIYPGRDSQSKRTLGTYPAMELDEARAKAKKWSAWVASGVDPYDGEQAELAKQREQEGNSFAAVAEAFITERESWDEKNRSIKQISREIRRELVSVWGDRPITSITASDVRALLGSIRKRSVFNARKSWVQAQLIFKFATHCEILTASPMASLDRGMIFRGAALGPRQTTLQTDEVAALWRSAGRLGHPYGPLYRMLLLTGCRLNELAKARWSEIHPEIRKAMRDAAFRGKAVSWAEVRDEFKTLTVPAARHKSETEHVVPLSDTACSVLETVARFRDCDWIFTETGRCPVNSFGKAKRKLDAKMLRSLQALARMRGLDPSEVQLTAFVNHDLRRVLRSNLSALQVADHIAEMCLGHGRRGLARVYDLHRYLPEIRRAMELWASRVKAITEPPTSPLPPDATVAPNVVKFDKRRA